MKVLLEAGAAVDACANDGWRPLQFSAQRGACNAARLLLRHGAQVDAPSAAGALAVDTVTMGAW